MSQFDYFGEQFTYAAEFPAFEWAEFQEALADDLDASTGRATGVALRFAVACVNPADRERFRRVSRQNRAKVEHWMVVFRDWTEESAERPTGLPSGSTTGPEITAPSSAQEPVASVTSLPERPGPRPDLALADSRSTG